MARYTDEPCRPGEHSFRRSRITDEPIGDCLTCGARLAWCEDQEDDPTLPDEPGPLCHHGCGPECLDCIGVLT